MMTSDDKVGGWVKKGQNHDDVILECPLTLLFPIFKIHSKQNFHQRPDHCDWTPCINPKLIVTNVMV